MPAWSELSPYDRLVNTKMVEPRAYQINIIKSVNSGMNTLVILPTGLGKTLIAVFAIAKALHEGKSAILLAPTKPLSEQHYQTLSSLLNVDKDIVLLLTGALSGKKREELEAHARVIAATPQTVANDLQKGRLSLKDFSVVVFDECHRAVGRYAYTYIADECKLRGIQLLGLTASPGGDTKRIEALLETLGIQNIEIRISTDSDVVPYVMSKEMTTFYVDNSSTINTILATLRPVIEEHLGNLYSKGLSPFKHFDNMSKRRVLEIGDNISKIQARNYKFSLLFDYTYLLDLTHAYDLVSTEGLYPFISYLDSLESRESKSRGVKSILSNTAVRAALNTAKSAAARGEEHPKMSLAVSVIKNSLAGKSVIVFAQYRSTIKKLVELFGANGISARAFVGKKEGITQGQQQQTINDFRDGKFSVLVATSIGEEGLDIPAVDAVILYEPVPSEIRNIQRKGRAGRIKFGRVIVLVASKTKDEKYLLISRLKERRMRDLVLKIKNRFEVDAAGAALTGKGQRTLLNVGNG
jgi:Fanconi anemia group M protein